MRHGLLGKAGVLMVSSYPNRTAPVLRGAWILDNITGTPPTPPPPNVEALKEAPVGAKVLSMREQMAVHRTNKSCFSCHGVMDPMGLALENFDGVGRWREKDRLAETRIDASGELPDGSKVNGPIDLRNALLDEPGPVRADAGDQAHDLRHGPPDGVARHADHPRHREAGCRG